MLKLDLASFAPIAKIRKEGCRPPRRYFLIVCEGEKTEPLYFEEIKKFLPPQMLKRVTIEGIGENTLSLIEKAEKLIQSSDVRYYYVWIIFDKDDFPSENFDSAIRIIKSRENKEPKWRAGWSNEAFELWYLCHFREITGGAISGTQCFDLLNEEFRKNKIQLKYKKNFKGMFNILRFRTEDAIKRAQKSMELQLSKKIPPSRMNPTTMVYLLVAELLSYMDINVYKKQE